MSIFPIGIAIALTAFVMAIGHLNQSLGNYYDFVALFVVLGGTVAVGIVLIPWNMRKDLGHGLMDLFKGQGANYKDVLNDCLNVIRESPTSYDKKTGYIHDQLLRDGVELIQLNMDKDKIIHILEERIIQYVKRRKKISNAIKSLAKYPPAFGLMGTVLGLVNVMRGVSGGLDGKQTALEMAVALVATMYGLLMANLVLNPAGELIAKRISEEESFGEIAISAIELYADKTSLLEAQELLNSFVPVEDRVNLLDSLGGAA